MQINAILSSPPPPISLTQLYAYRVFPEHNPGHLPQDRWGGLDQVEARGLGGNLYLPLLDHMVQLHQILEGVKQMSCQSKASWRELYVYVEWTIY